MTWKIESISFKNFKFFKDEFTLNLAHIAAALGANLKDS